MKKSVPLLMATLCGALTCTTITPLVTPVASAQSSFSSGSSPASQPAPPAAPPSPWAEDISDGLIVNLIGDLLGPGISNHVGVMTGDLGTMTALGADGEFAIIFGDSFRGARFGQGDWLSPIGVVAEMDEMGRIVITRPLNDGRRVQQLVNYHHNDRGLTLLPSDIINIDGVLYMQAMWNEGVGNVLYTQIWKSTDRGTTWKSISTTPASYSSPKTKAP